MNLRIFINRVNIVSFEKKIYFLKSRVILKGFDFCFEKKILLKS